MSKTRETITKLYNENYTPTAQDFDKDETLETLFTIVSTITLMEDYAKQKDLGNTKDLVALEAKLMSSLEYTNKKYPNFIESFKRANDDVRLSITTNNKVQYMLNIQNLKTNPETKIDFAHDVYQRMTAAPK